MDDTLYHRPDKPHLPGYVGWRGAGTVLTWLSLITQGTTWPFAVVLCVEWLRDPRRTDEHRHWDKATLVFAVPGALLLLVWSSAMALTFQGFERAFVPYWCGFALWLIGRLFTRWREIGELRKLDAAVPAVPKAEPISADAVAVNPVVTEATPSPTGPPPALGVERGLREALERGLIALTASILLFLFGQGVFFAPFAGDSDPGLLPAGDAILLLGWLVLLVACAAWTTYAPNGPYRFLRTWCILACVGLPVTLFLALLRGPRTHLKGEPPPLPDLFHVLTFAVPVLVATAVLTIVRWRAVVRTRPADNPN